MLAKFKYWLGEGHRCYYCRRVFVFKWTRGPVTRWCCLRHTRRLFKETW